MGTPSAATGIDFRQGVALADIPARGMLAGRVGDEPILLSRIDGELYAVSGACTHYGGALGDGLADSETVRCPLHHACFSLKTGAALRAPAFEPLQRWQVRIEDGRAFVDGKLAPAAAEPRSLPGDVGRILIVGGGAAGFACAERLRRLGFARAVTIASADSDPPCDRPNLSKDYLAGNAPEEWIPLRGTDWYAEQAIDLRLTTEVVGIDPDSRVALTRAGDRIGFDRLLLATGSEPVRLDTPGFDRPNVFTLRSPADARRIIAALAPGKRAAVLGSSFIGMEVAASLRAREVGVDVVSTATVPFRRTLGQEVGDYLRRLHHSRGVTFHLGREATGFDGRLLTLDDGSVIGADLVIVGIGVRPRTALAAAAGLEVAYGVCVDAGMETSAAGIFAAGDIAAYPDPHSGQRLRSEHWVTAERQGQVAAANMLGGDEEFADVPFFWTEQYGQALRYVGDGTRWDEVRIDGDLAAGAFTAAYYDHGRLCASASLGRDMQALTDGRLLEQGEMEDGVR